jgi:glutamate synthase (NADPH/NADH) small chain
MSEALHSPPFALPAERLERDMGEWKAPYTPDQAVAEALRCLFCHDAPCTRICPTHIDIPGFIRKIATGNVHGAARTILDANILGASCARVCPVEVLCVGDCVYNATGQPPIQIGKLQRFATDAIVDAGVQLFEAAPTTGRKVALVGAGPASLACAHELRRLGHEPVIFEKRGLPGGLNTTGVAPYKMKADYALLEVSWVLGIGGIDVQTGREVGGDVPVDELLSAYDAVFLGPGLGPDSVAKTPGEDLPGVVGAVELIERFKNEPRSPLEVQSAVVVGGGNTALDVVRQLRRLGVPRVTMVYRRTEAEMPGYEHELAAAKKEGVRFEFLVDPVAYEGDDRVERVRLLRMAQGEPDESGRRSPRPIPGSEHTVDADLVVLAIGQGKLRDLLALFAEVSLDMAGRVVVDEACRTGNPRIWAGGDCINGGKEVVNAAADGKKAARSIHAALMEGNRG